MQADSAPTIRAATPGDVPTILDFILKLAEYERLAHEAHCTPAQLHENLFGKNPVIEALIGEVDGKPVGFALFFRTFSTFVGKPGIWLEDLFVLPECRGKGVGKLLLKRLAAIVRERNYGRLEWSVLDWNEPSIQFYRKLGAVPMSDWTTYRVVGPALEKLASAD